MRRLRRWTFLPLSCLIWLALFLPLAGADRHQVFGDFQMEIPSDLEVPPGLTFSVILRWVGGAIFGRDTVSPGGRFRFNNVPNGEYVLTVEYQGNVVYRETFTLYITFSSDLRKDINVVWKGGGDTEEVEQPTITYARSPHSSGTFQHAQSALETGDLELAISLLEEVVGEDPADFEAWTDLGTAFFRDGRLEEAESAYREALEGHSDYLPAKLNLGKVQIAREEFEAALETLVEAVELDPNRAESQQLVGECYLQLQKGSKAVDYLYEALRLDPDGMAEVHLRLARLYHLAGYPSRAASEYAAYLTKRPDDPKAEELRRYISDHEEK